MRYLITMGLVVLGGCVGGALESDQRAIRESLLTLYEEQVFDNLVRIKQHRMIVHLDYTKLTGDIRQTSTGSVNLVGNNNSRSDTATVGGSFVQANAINVIA